MMAGKIVNNKIIFVDTNEQQIYYQNGSVYNIVDESTDIIKLSGESNKVLSAVLVLVETLKLENLEY